MHTLLLLISLMRALFGILKSQSSYYDLTLLGIFKVCFSCWNEQKYPHTRVEVVFITWAEKRTVMCLCGVTGRSGQYTPNSSVYSVTGRCPAFGQH